MISPKSMLLTTDKPNATSDLKPERLASVETVIAPKVWHKAVVEVRGRRMMAQIDDKPPIMGESARVDVDKVDYGFPITVRAR